MDYYTVSLLIGVASIIASLVSVAYWLGGRLTKMDSRLTGMESRLTGVESKLTVMDSRLTGVEKGIERLGEGLGRLANAINGVGEAIVDYLGFRGVLKPEEATYLKSDIKRLTSIATNPFTEAERRRLLELVDKDDLTLEEAEELHNLARKFYREYIEKTPDAWKVLYYAAAKHGEVLRKHSKQTSQQPSQPPT
jgi:polyhydroxyalkanoate synthesis regulator phasin